MHAALLPVRALSSAKGRLGGLLSAAEREALTRAMLADMIAALAASRAVERTYVVSADRAVLAEAAALGADALDEGAPRGLNAAVAYAAERLGRSGVTRLLVIPGDCPLIEPGEIDAVFALDPAEFPVVMVPSSSGAGTNALLLTPPDVLVPRFEGSSLDAHRKACRSLGLRFRVLPLESFALDVDTPEDLAALAARGAHRRSGRAVSPHRPAAA